MDTIFYGLIFLLIDIRINGFSLMPAFVGYLLLYYGLEKVRHESSQFAALQPWCLVMAVLQGCLYVAGFFGVITSGTVNILLSLAGTALCLYILWRLTRGVAETERRYPGADLAAATLQQRWCWLLIFDGVLTLLSLLPGKAFFALLLILACFVVHILFLMAFHRCRRGYAAAKETAGGEAPPPGPEAE